jgi:hypothetical protein
LAQQQLWCWGADIRRTEGNLLIRYGMTKTPIMHAERERRSRYTACVGPGAKMTLWGAGLLYADAALGALYLDRFDTTPRYSEDWQAASHVLEPTALPTVRPPRTWSELCRSRRLILGICTWVAAYEQWVANECGTNYRAQTIAARKGDPIDAQRVVAAWREIAERLDAELKHCLANLADGSHAPSRW